MYILVGHLAAVRCVQYDGKLVVSGAYDYLVKVWVPERQECIHTLQGHTNRVYSLQVNILRLLDSCVGIKHLSFSSLTVSTWCPDHWTHPFECGKRQQAPASTHLWDTKV